MDERTLKIACEGVDIIHKVEAVLKRDYYVSGPHVKASALLAMVSSLSEGFKDEEVKRQTKEVTRSLIVLLTKEEDLYRGKP